MEYYINKIKKEIKKYSDNGKFNINRLIEFTTNKVPVVIYGTNGISDKPILKLISLKKQFGISTIQLTDDIKLHPNIYLLNELSHVLVGFYAKSTCSFSLNIGNYNFQYTIFPEQHIITFDNLYPLLLCLCIYQQTTITFLSGNINDLYLLMGHLINHNVNTLISHNLESINKMISYNNGWIEMHNIKREHIEETEYSEITCSKRQCID